MKNLTVKNISDDLYARLKSAAQAQHRSLNSEVIARLEKSLTPHAVDTDELVARARAIRTRVKGPKLTVTHLLGERDDRRR